MIENDIQYDFYKADSHKLGIINRFHRTLKEKLEKYFIVNNTVKWIDVIDKIIYNYNNTYHTGIKIEPAKVNALIENDIVQTKKAITKYIKKDEIVYMIGDKVRIRTIKTIFEKNKALFSDVVYTITKVNKNTVVIIDKEKNVKSVKKSNLLKVDKVENETNKDNMKKAIKENKVDRQINKEGIKANLSVEPRELRKRTPKPIIPPKPKKTRKPKEQFYMQEILDKVIIKGKVYYKVRWEDNDITYQPEKQMKKEAPNMIEEYENII